MRIGVLAVQGDFARHVQTLQSLGADVVEIRKAEQLKGLNGIIIPGGESTTFQIMLDLHGLGSALRTALSNGLPVWGTCAGAIMLGKGNGIPQPRFNLIDVEVVRNGFGRQVDSFVTSLRITFLQGDFPGVFIRAPRFTAAGRDVELLASHNGEPVMVRQGRVVISSFHPELTPDDRIHKWFIETVCKP